MARATTKKSTTTKSSSTKTTTARKTTGTTTAKTTAPAKTAAGVSAPKLAAVPSKSETAATKSAAAAPVVASEVKKRELYDRVATLSGVKKQQVKPIVDAVLSVMGDALDAGEDLNLEPLGKVKIQREKELPTAKVITCRVRRKTGAPVVKTPLAKAAE